MLLTQGLKISVKLAAHTHKQFASKKAFEGKKQIVCTEEALHKGVNVL